MKALILAAGYGTRLYPLTLDRPKALVKVGGKSILERIVKKLAEVDDCTGVYVVSNDKFSDMIENWINERRFEIPIALINDKTVSNDDRLGAIGDMQLVVKEKRPAEDLLVLAGDNLFEFDLSDFISFAKKKKTLCVALYDVKEMDLAKKYGIVKVDGSGRMEKFQEKPEAPESTLASTGIYYLPQEVLADLDEYSKTGLTKDAPGNFVRWVSEKKDVYGFVFTEKWYDIGDRSSLEKADMEYRYKEL